VNRQSPFASLLVLALVAAIALLSVACGRKAMPETINSEDKFDFSQTNSTLSGNCVTIRTLVTGNLAMLDFLSIQYEDMTVACPTCPFRAQGRMDFRLDDDRVRMAGDKISLTWCGLSGGKEYRYRLAGYNRLSALQPAFSPVLSNTNNPSSHQE